MPYAHKYANAAAELGMLGAVRSFLPEENKLGALLRGGMSLARQDVEGLARLLIDAEMKMFAGLNTPVIFLQNVATDFLLGLGFDEAFKIFADCVRERYRRGAGVHHDERSAAAEATGEAPVSRIRSSAPISTRSASECAAACRPTRI